MANNEKAKSTFVEEDWSESTPLTDCDTAYVQCALDVREKRTHPALTSISIDDVELAVDAAHAAANANHPRGRAMIDIAAENAVELAGNDATAFGEPMQASSWLIELYIKRMDMQENPYSPLALFDMLAECDRSILEIELVLESNGYPNHGV